MGGPPGDGFHIRCFAHPREITLPKPHPSARRLPRLAFGLPLSYHIRASAEGARSASRAF
jgi:hypothetical protein